MSEVADLSRVWRQMFWVCDSCGHVQTLQHSGKEICGGCGVEASYDNGKAIWLPQSYLLVTNGVYV